MIAICINGLLLQMVQLTVQYFSYETGISAKINKDIHSPALTICLPFLQEINKFRDLYREENFKNTNNNNNITVGGYKNNQVLYQELMEFFYSKYTFKQLFNKSFSHEKISCLIKKTATEKFENCSKPIESIYNESKCFTYYFHSLKVNSIIMVTSNFSMAQKHNDSNTETRKTQICLHPQTIIPLSDEQQFIDIRENKKTEIIYWWLNINQLSPPYSSCKFYYKTWSRFDCIHECIVDIIKSSYDCIPSFHRLLSNDFIPETHFCNIHLWNNNQTFALHLIKSQCNQKCIEVKFKFP